MVQIKTELLKFGSMGEKTGWTYISIPAGMAQKIKPGYKRSFRVKGKLDDHELKAAALIPMGEGDYILPVNATMRKAIRKKHGDKVILSLEADERELSISPSLLLCLEDDPAAKKFFNSLPGSHRNYFSKWIESAKTEATKAKRIARAVHALGNKLGYAEMIRLKKDF